MQRGVIAPIPLELDRDRMAIRVGQRLGVPAMAVHRLPAWWVNVALIDLEVETVQQRKRQRQSEAAQRQAAKRQQASRR